MTTCRHLARYGLALTVALFVGVLAAGCGDRGVDEMPDRGIEPTNTVDPYADDALDNDNDAGIGDTNIGGTDIGNPRTDTTSPGATDATGLGTTRPGTTDTTGIGTTEPGVADPGMTEPGDAGTPGTQMDEDATERTIRNETGNGARPGSLPQ